MTINRSSYSLAGQAIAIRVSGDPVGGNNGLFYYYADHLGSTSLLVNSGNGVVAGSTTRYLPFGGYRTKPTQTITDRDFTGQKENMELGPPAPGGSSGWLWPGLWPRHFSGLLGG